MSEASTDLGYMDRHVDIKRIEYYGHSNPDCELDLKKSAFLEPTVKEFNYHQERNLAEEQYGKKNIIMNVLLIV